MSNMASDAKACFSSKVQYRAIIQYLIIQVKQARNYTVSQPMFMGLLHHLMLRLNSGQGNSNEVERLQKMKPGLDTHWMPTMKKSVRKFGIWYTLMQIQGEEIAQASGISHGTISTTLHHRLGMCKLTACWVLKSLSDEQMATRASVCSALLKHFKSKDDFLLRLVTVDETWVHYYEPENKIQSCQWVGPGSPRPKKFKTQPSAGKVKATVFWDTKGIIMLEILPKRSTITGVYYANLLDQLRTAICEKRRGKLSKGVLLQQDNSRTLAKLQQMLWSKMSMN